MSGARGWGPSAPAGGYRWGSMGELLLTLGFSGLVATAAGVVDGWLAAGYLGVVCAVVVMLLCAGQFARSHWPGLLFWFGAALGACVAQGFVLVAR